MFPCGTRCNCCRALQHLRKIQLQNGGEAVAELGAVIDEAPASLHQHLQLPCLRRVRIQLPEPVAMMEQQIQQEARVSRIAL